MLRGTFLHSLVIRTRVSVTLLVLGIVFALGCEGADGGEVEAPTAEIVATASALSEDIEAIEIPTTRASVSPASTPSSAGGVSTQAPSSDSLSSSLLVGDDRYGGSLRIDYRGLFIPDPAVSAVDHDDFMLYAELYSGLTKISDEAGFPAVGELAESWSVDESGLSYEFRLRPDLKFSDGSPVTASDFKWSWERALSPWIRSRRSLETLGLIRGAEQIVDGSTTDLVGVNVIDDRTLSVELVSPITQFLYLLADPSASVLKRENVENWGVSWGRWWQNWTTRPGPDTFNELPVGTGPFMLTAFDDWENTATLSRNPHYWEGAVYLDRIDFVPYGYFFNAPQEFVVSEHLLKRWSDVLSSAFTVSEENDYGEEQVDSVAVATDFLMFNTAVEPYDDVHFRRALVALAPSQLDASTYFGVSPNVVTPLPATSIVPPDNPVWDDSVSRIPEDIETAREAISSSKYSDRLDELDLTYLTDFPEDGTYIRELQEIWSDELGVDVEIMQVELSQYRNWINSGEMQMRKFTIIPRYPDPHAILGQMDRLFGNRPQAVSAETEELSRMLEDAATEPDAALRLEKYRDVERYILDNALAMPLSWSSSDYRSILQPWINGYKVPKYYGSRFKDVWIDQSHPDYRALDDNS